MIHTQNERCFHCGDLISEHSGPKCLKCPCGSNAKTELQLDREDWAARIAVEREKQIAKGYEAAHDAEHGVTHLLNWAIEYSRIDKPLASSALIRAALDLVEGLVVVTPEATRDDLLPHLYRMNSDRDHSARTLLRDFIISPRVTDPGSTAHTITLPERDHRSIVDAVAWSADLRLRSPRVTGIGKDN